MKSIVVCKCAVGLLFLPILAVAQTTPEAFLAQLPAIPNTVCGVDSAVVNHFSNRIATVQASLQQVIDQIHAEAESNLTKTQNNMRATIAQQSGLSQADMARLEQDNVSDDEAEAVADKVMRNTDNVSLAEMQSLSEMSEADQEKWAQNYANQQMKQAQENPQQVKQKQDKNAHLYALAKEQKEIGERIQAKMNELSQLAKAIELQDTLETRTLQQKSAPLEKQLCSGICTPAEIARSNAAEKQIYSLHRTYCSKLSPMQLAYVARYLTVIKGLFPDYRRLTVVQNELSKINLGVEPVHPDLSCYAAVDEYMHVLASAYNYWVAPFEQY